MARLYGELRAWLEMAYTGRSDCPFIVSYQGQAIREYKRAWNTARHEAGLPNLLVHDLRRTAVRNMVRAGIPEKQAMLISGHKTRSVFERYNITDEHDIKIAGGKMERYMEELAATAEVVTKVVTVSQARKLPNDENRPILQ